MLAKVGWRAEVIDSPFIWLLQNRCKNYIYYISNIISDQVDNYNEREIRERNVENSILNLSFNECNMVWIMQLFRFQGSRTHLRWLVYIYIQINGLKNLAVGNFVMLIKHASPNRTIKVVSNRGIYQKVPFIFRNILLKFGIIVNLKGSSSRRKNFMVQKIKQINFY